VSVGDGVQQSRTGLVLVAGMGGGQMLPEIKVTSTTIFGICWEQMLMASCQRLTSVCGKRVSVSERSVGYKEGRR